MSEREFTLSDIERWIASRPGLTVAIVAFCLSDFMILLAYALYLGLQWRHLGLPVQIVVSLGTIGALIGVGAFLLHVGFPTARLRRLVRRRLARTRLLRLVSGKVLLVALLTSIVVGCRPISSQAQPSVAGQKPCAESTARLDMRLHKVAAATFSAAISVRQSDQTHVLVVDLVDGRVCSLGTWATADVHDVYLDEDQTVFVVDFEATYVVRYGVTAKGPRQAVHGVLFARQGSQTRIIAYIDKRGPSQTFQSAGQFIFDLTAPDQPRQLADTGGVLLGQLDDGTILFSGGVTNATLPLRAVSLDGTVTTLATVSPARYALELHKKPRQEVTVAVPGTEPGFNDIVTVDLASGAQTKTGKVPIVSSEAPRRASPDDAFVAQNTSELLGGVRVTTPSGDELLAVHVSTGTGYVTFRGWVRR